MSRLILHSQRDAAPTQLFQRLLEEFQHYDDADSEYHQPLINVERVQGRTHLLVIWDVWKTLNQQERSRLISDAYLTARGQAAALDVKVAMGLTQEEARELGINFEPTAVQA